MANYKVNTAAKTVTLDIKKLTAGEKEIVQMYVSAGYAIKEKRKGLSYADMRKALKGKESLLKELDGKIKSKENYMKIKKWFSEQV